MTAWVEALKTACSEKSQSQVAAELRQRDGFPSQTVINQVINGRYPSEKGRERLKVLVEGYYMDVTVNCPVLDEIGLDECLEWQSLPFFAANSVRVEMFRACLNCPNRRIQS